jgi:hypothetical protein
MKGNGLTIGETNSSFSRVRVLRAKDLKCKQRQREVTGSDITTNLPSSGFRIQVYFVEGFYFFCNTLSQEYDTHSSSCTTSLLLLFRPALKTTTPAQATVATACSSRKSSGFKVSSEATSRQAPIVKGDKQTGHQGAYFKGPSGWTLLSGLSKLQLPD